MGTFLGFLIDHSSSDPRPHKLKGAPLFYVTLRKKMMSIKHNTFLPYTAFVL